MSIVYQDEDTELGRFVDLKWSADKEEQLRRLLQQFAGLDLQPGKAPEVLASRTQTDSRFTSTPRFSPSRILTLRWTCEH